jgi:hypothetical protein
MVKVWQRFPLATASRSQDNRDGMNTTRKNLAAILTLLVLSMAVAKPLRAQDAAKQESNELKTTNYETLALGVEPIASNTANITEGAVLTRTELRMRSVGLKPVSAISVASSTGTLDS